MNFSLIDTDDLGAIAVLFASGSPLLVHGFLYCSPLCLIYWCDQHILFLLLLLILFSLLDGPYSLNSLQCICLLSIKVHCLYSRIDDPQWRFLFCMFTGRHMMLAWVMIVGLKRHLMLLMAKLQIHGKGLMC